MVVGEKYYIIGHAYHHYIGEVVEILPITVVLKNAIKVHGCSRNWSDFLRDGCKDDTRYDVIPDGSEVPNGSMCGGAYPWKHRIPGVKK